MIAPPDQVQKILVIQLRQVGDVLLAAPVVRALEERYPDASLHYLVETYSAAAARGIPGVDELVEVPRKLSLGETLALRTRLREAAYDLVVDVQSNQKTGIYSWFTGAPVRLGFEQPWYKLHTRLFYSNQVPRNFTPDYTCRYRLDLLRPLGIETDDVSLGYRPPPEAVEKARSWLQSQGASNAGWLGLSPGGRIELKSWPLQHFARLGKGLLGRGFRIVVLFGPGEEQTARDLRWGLGDLAVLEESASFEDHAALMSLLGGVAVNDGGNLHLAAAVGTPSVTIFGPTDPTIWAPPDRTRHRWLRGDCTCTPAEVHTCSPRKCLQEVSPDAVLEEFLELIGYAPMAV